MNTEKKEELVYSEAMQEAFYAEELEDRFEMAAAVVASPNGVCWHILDSK